jgi:hypothetical protein
MVDLSSSKRLVPIQIRLAILIHVKLLELIVNR